MYRQLRSFTSLASLLFASVCITFTALPARAQELSSTEKILRQIVGQFAGVGGYWFSDATATKALGTPKFGGDDVFYVRPAHVGHVTITGGLELAGASDHWFPFSGGNSFSLTGASMQISGDRHRVGRLVPYLRFGLFAGNVHSKLQNFDTTSVVPSVVFGAEMKVHRYVSVNARYRISGEVAHINTDGFSAGIHIF
jgi:hypothetical protein